MRSSVNTPPAFRKSLVGLERGERLVERARHLRHLGQLLRRQVVEVLVDRVRRLDPVLHAVEAGHQHRREGQVRVARRVGAAELEALGLRALRVERDAHARRAVALAVHEVDRRLVAGHQPLVGVRRRRGEGEDRRGVGEQAADVPAGHVGQPGVAGLVEEQRLAALPQRLVDVHARAVVLEDRLGHERRRLAVLPGDVLDDVLVRASACRPSPAACRSACRSRPGRRCPPRGAAPRPRCRGAPASRTISERRSWKWSIGGTGK